jgi:calcineurin-like phosphoesterase family protein
MDNITVTKEEEVISTRKRSEANEKKIVVLKAFLDIIGEEDVDTFFLSTLQTAKERGYNLQEEPEALLQRFQV